MIRWSLVLPVLGCVLIALAAGLGAGHLAGQRAMADLRQTGEADARIRLALIESEIARYRLLPLALSDDRDVIAAEQAGTRSGGVIRALNTKLERLAKATGASAIYVVDRKGLAIAASNWAGANSFVGENYGFRRYVLEAWRTGNGQQFALGTVSRKPGLYLAQRTRGGGAVVVKLEFDWIEDQWRQAGGITFVTNRAGVIFVTSKPDWRFAATRPLDAGHRDETLRDSGARTIHPRPWTLRKDELLAVPDTKVGYLLVNTRPDPDGWQLNLALPASQRVGQQERLAGIAVGVVVLALSLLLLWFLLRSRRRRARTNELENAVVSRTAELRREMEQRAALEGRAAQLREELRLANRLATLGQVSASVAHETAQPVAAIRNYAATARTFLDRGEVGEVVDNLSAIDRLAERIGVVTAQLRGFARKKTAGGARCELAEAIEGARILLRDRLASVDLKLPALPNGLRVVGDTVRIEQILVNLLQNALDAVFDRDDPQIVVEADVEAGSERVVLRICDNGPGISPEIAQRLFTPFSTSRDEGLGLGLVIAQDIAAEFGGSLRCLDAAGAGSGKGHALSGACFELVLRIVQ